MKKMFRYLFNILFIFIVFLLFNYKVSAKTSNVYVFYGETCPRCEEAMKYLNKIKKRYDLNIYSYEVWYNDDNALKMNTVADYLDINVEGVPFIIINNTPIIGYREGVTDDTYLYHIKKTKSKDFVDEIGNVLGINEKNEINKGNAEVINSDVNNKSLLYNTFILGVLDVFNPLTLFMIFMISLLFLGRFNKKNINIFSIISVLIINTIYILSYFYNFNLSNYISLFRNLLALSLLLICILNLYYILNNIEVKSTVNNKWLKSKVLFMIFFIIIIVLASIYKIGCTGEIENSLKNLFTNYKININLRILYSIFYFSIYVILTLFILLILLGIYKLFGLFNKYQKYSIYISIVLLLIISLILVTKPEWLMIGFRMVI